MHRLEIYLIQSTNNPSPKIVMTFENLFFLKHSYKIIDTDFEKIVSFDKLPIYNFPYKKMGIL